MENFGILNLNQYVEYESFSIELLVNALKDLFCSLGSGHLDDSIYQIERKYECDKRWKLIKHDIENELRKSYMQYTRTKEWTRRIVFPFDENRNRILRSFCGGYDARTVYRHADKRRKKRHLESRHCVHIYELQGQR